MSFLIVEALVPVKYSHVRVLSPSEAPLATFSWPHDLLSMSLDMQSSYTVQLSS